ncbi:hypothetical protein PM082_002112 [Marasmius tenuissimus]|nr:hypothetical protein PM082_002112 [Marasmius tenuissimus]
MSRVFVLLVLAKSYGRCLASNHTLTIDPTSPRISGSKDCKAPRAVPEDVFTLSYFEDRGGCAGMWTKKVRQFAFSSRARTILEGRRRFVSPPDSTYTLAVTCRSVVTGRAVVPCHENPRTHAKRVLPTNIIVRTSHAHTDPIMNTWESINQGPRSYG